MKISIADLATIVDAGDIVGVNTDTNMPAKKIVKNSIEDVVVDSRRAKKNSLFVALPGSIVDGHDYLEKAFAAGSTAALISRTQWSVNKICFKVAADRFGAILLVVDEPLVALHQLAIAHRLRRQALRIAVTGSNGKTTTRHILASILAQNSATYESERNYNSDIGLPLAVLGIESHHQLAVLEAGVDYVGEMNILGKILLPHYAVITNIGSAHLAAFQSRRHIATEKSKLFFYLRKGGQAFVPEDETLLSATSLLLPPQVKLVKFGPATTQGYEGSESLGLDGSLIHWEGLQIHFPLFGSHNISNVLAAITVASTMGVDPLAIKRGIESIRPVPGRSQVIRGRLTILNDAYNANPESMSAIIQFLGQLPRQGRIFLVLGSMLELGPATTQAHTELGKLIAAVKPDAVYLFGEATAPVAATLKSGKHDFPVLWTTEYKELEEAVVKKARAGDTVLLKGSRGVALERLIRPLQAA